MDPMKKRPAHVPAAGTAQPSASSAPRPGSYQGPRQYTILLVDDEDDLRATIRRALRGSDYRIIEAASAAEAIERLAIDEVDAVITDYNMPGVSGLDLLQRVRLAYPEILRIMLTGSREVDVAVRALNEGAAERYILKPWDNLDLKGMVAIALATHRRHRGLRELHSAPAAETIDYLR
jgi:CheY-like chemotaxis protein